MVNLHNKETVLVEMYEQLTLWIINDIVTRIIKSQELTNTDVYRIYKLQELGIHFCQENKHKLAICYYISYNKRA